VEDGDLLMLADEDSGEEGGAVAKPEARFEFGLELERVGGTAAVDGTATVDDTVGGMSAFAISVTGSDVAWLSCISCTILDSSCFASLKIRKSWLLRSSATCARIESRN